MLALIFSALSLSASSFFRKPGRAHSNEPRDIFAGFVLSPILNILKAKIARSRNVMEVRRAHMGAVEQG